MVARGESAELASKLVKQSATKQKIERDQLILHADNGPSMTSKALALKLADLGVTKSHSRPYVSDDNPFSESHFKTLKYRPEFPDRFGSLEDARAHCRGFFRWYNREHHHSGIALLTPHMVHYGLAPAVLGNRQRVLTAAYQQHPERFVRRPPRPAPLPGAVWLGRPLVWTLCFSVQDVARPVMYRNSERPVSTSPRPVRDPPGDKPMRRPGRSFGTPRPPHRRAEVLTR